MTKSEIERRFAEIDASPAEAQTEEEKASLAAAEAEDDGSVVELEQFKQELAAYSGKVMLRIPRSLHKALKEAAAAEGVSLNQYMLYKLAQ